MVEYRYREAMPRLNGVTAMAALKRGKTVCHFFNEQGYQVGEALVIFWSEAGIGLEYSGGCFELSAAGAGWAGRTEFDTVVAARKNNSGRARVYLKCPDCGKPFGILIYKGRWACGNCLKLGYRSQFVPPDVFDRLKRDALQSKIGRGRPKGMRQATYRTALSDLAALKKKAAGRFPSVVSVAHERVIRATWMTPEEAGYVIHPDYGIVDGEIVRRQSLPVETDHYFPSPAEVAMPAAPEPKPIRWDPSALDGPTKKSDWLDD